MRDLSPQNGRSEATAGPRGARDEPMLRVEIERARREGYQTTLVAHDELGALLDVEEAAQHVASTLIAALNRSDRLQAELTAYGVPVNVLAARLADLHEVRHA